MNLIRIFWRSLFNANKLNQKNKQTDEQSQLVLLVCIFSFLISAVSLFVAKISPYLIAFILIILFLLACYTVIANKKNAEYQIRTLSNLIESMVDGDYTLRGRTHKNKAFQELLLMVNNLADTLFKHKLEAKESRLLLERIMDQMDAMVLATDESGCVVMANASANKLLLGGVDCFSDINLASIAIGAEIVAANTGIIEFTETQLIGEHFLHKELFLSEGKQHQLYLLTNAERLLMEKERNAWQSLLRVLSHEMNNSLTPIATISQSIQKRLQKNRHEIDRTSLLEGIDIINERANSLSSFILSYSQLSQLPKPNKASFCITTMVNSIAALYPHCVVNINLSSELIITADKGQFEQVLINIFKNAVEAMQNTSQKIIDFSCSQDNNFYHFTIADHGNGIANVDNIFVPFYTTKAQGSGIGLALCRQILFNHNGLIKLQNKHQGKGVEVVISIP